jgi:hypothetical protein
MDVLPGMNAGVSIFATPSPIEGSRVAEEEVGRPAVNDGASRLFFGDDRLALCNYLAWDKIVQTLGGVLSVASRPSHCRHATCEGANLRLLSAEAQGIALAGSTYGYDVMATM